MGTEPRITQQTISVLSALVETRELSGSEIAKETGLASGTLYPLVYRLEKAGWLDSRWEKGDPATLGRPRRRYYRITAEGQKRVARIVHELGGKLAWA